MDIGDGTKWTIATILVGIVVGFAAKALTGELWMAAVGAVIGGGIVRFMQVRKTGTID